MRGNPQLSAIALLVRKFGTRIPGGGYEVEVTHRDMELHKVKWQYFPNPTIEGVGGVVPDDAGSVTIEGKLTEEGEKLFNELQSPQADDRSTT